MLTEREYQFVFSEQLTGGLGFPDCIGSARLVRVLKHTRKRQPIPEGELAMYCRQRVYDPTWQQDIKTLIDWGFIKTESSLKGHARRILLTEQGATECERIFGPKNDDEVEPQPEREKKPGEVFAEAYLQVTGKPLE